MDVFSYRDAVITDYKRFTTSFTQIKAPDIKDFIVSKYDDGHYWPAPLIQLNPSFVSGKTAKELVDDGNLHKECEHIFRFGRDKEGSLGHSIRLHKHQEEAVHIAQRRESYVLTTGTGSGKSLSYILPIVDEVLKAKASNPKPSGLEFLVLDEQHTYRGRQGADVAISSEEFEIINPNFLMHDCPREADMSEQLYKGVLELLLRIEVEISGKGEPPFQYFLTTTTPPPKSLCASPYVRLELLPGDEESLLFKRRFNSLRQERLKV